MARSFGVNVMGVAAAILLCNQPVLARNADTILHGGRVFTSDARALWAQAVAIRDGHILAVGANSAVLRHASGHTRFIDLEGRLVVPGFNDAHVHTTPYGLVINATDFPPGPGPSIAEIMDDLAEAVTQYPAGTWLTGIIGEAVLNDPHMNRTLLDTASPNHPVLLMYWWGHGAFVNTAGMLAAGISETAADPEGGWYGRDPITQVLDGSLHEYAGFRLSRQLVDLMPLDEARAALQAFATAAVRLGITSLQDLSFSSSGRQQQIFAGLSLPVRIRNICFPFSSEDTCTPVTLNHPNSRTTWGGFKRILDGGLIDHGAALYEPYTDLPSQAGRLDFSLDFLRPEMQESLCAWPFYGQRINHVVGDRTIDFYLDALDATAPAFLWRFLRPRLEHARMASLDRIHPLRDHGIVIVQNPTQFAQAEVLMVRLGPERIKRAALSASLLRAGIPLAIGSDVSGQPFNPLVDLMLTVTNPTQPNEGLTLEEAVIAHTYGSAYAEFEEYRKGTLAPGMLADLVVLSQDIFQIPIEAVPGTHVVMTMVGGREVYSTGELGVP